MIWNDTIILKQIVFSNGTDEPICRAGKEMQMQRMDLWMQWGKGSVG